MECFRWLTRCIYITSLLALHKAMLAVQRRLNNTVPDGLGHDVFRALLTSQMQAYADVAQGDARVRQGHHADASLDDVLSQSQNQRIGAVSSEGVGMICDGRLEVLQVADTDCLHQKEVRVQSLLHRSNTEGGAVRDITHQQLNDQQKLGRRLSKAEGAET